MFQRSFILLALVVIETGCQTSSQDKQPTSDKNVSPTVVGTAGGICQVPLSNFQSPTDKNLSYCIEYYGTAAGPSARSDCEEQNGTYAQIAACTKALATCNAVTGGNGLVMHYYVEAKLPEARQNCAAPFKWVGP